MYPDTILLQYFLICALQGELLLDMYLCRHVDSMTKKIRNRAIIQFFYPYTSVDLNQMAKALNYDPTLLEKQVCQLISSGSISARIDGYEKVFKLELHVR